VEQRAFGPEAAAREKEVCRERDGTTRADRSPKSGENEIANCHYENQEHRQ